MQTWSQEAFVSGLGLSLLHSLWQGALLGVVGMALHRRLQRAAPELRCGVFYTLLLTFFAVWLGTFACLYVQGLHTLASATGALAGPIYVGLPNLSPAAAASPAPMRLLQALSPWLVMAWALGVCTLSVRHLGGLMLLSRWCKTETVACLPAWEACAARLATQMGIGRKILLRCSAQIDVPFAFGLFKSYILLPASAMMGLTPEQTEALIAHELAHIARHDVFFNLVQVCMETILFYHPVVWWFSMQIRVAREQRCDDLAVQVIGDRALYARALYSLEEARATIPQLALGAKGDHSKMTNRHLIHRIQRVLGVSAPERRDPWVKGALALAAAAIGLATLMPVRAYSRPAPHSPTEKQGATAKDGPIIKTVTNVLLNINGDKIELNTTDLKPDTPVKVNGKEGRFGDLTPQQQKELQEALHKIHLVGGKHNVMVKIRKSGEGAPGGDVKSVRITKSSTKVMLNINGDKIELNTTELTPDTRLKVNGKEGRFGDLTARQQEQLRAAMAQVHIVTVSGASSVSVEEALQGLDLPEDVKNEIILKVKKELPPPPAPQDPSAKP